MRRRTRPQIFVEILKAIAEETRISGEAKITRVQSRVYVPFNRFQQYIEKMRNLGLIKTSSIVITEKGLKLLEEYRTVKDILEKFGLE